MDNQAFRKLKKHLKKQAVTHYKQVLQATPAATNGYIKHEAKRFGLDLQRTRGLRRFMFTIALEVREYKHSRLMKAVGDYVDTHPESKWDEVEDKLRKEMNW